MDGRGRWLDNVFIERLWRSLNYEEVCLKGYADGREAHAGIAGWMGFTTDFVLTKRSPAERRWPCGVKVSPAPSLPTLWTCRCAWTTLARRPHAHRDNCNSNRCLKWRDRRGRSRPALQSRTTVQWSRQWVQFKRSCQRQTHGLLLAVA
jgi:hypothetical protein